MNSKLDPKDPWTSVILRLKNETQTALLNWFEASVLNEEWADGSPILKLTRKPPAEIVERLSVMDRFSWVRPKARVETEE